ncbi:MAG: tetratricopeptide repeat protein, partial [Actinobacteria bacterium]|nr:tetratricopeptide repeat protein [Actinomycetota bacterium]
MVGVDRPNDIEVTAVLHRDAVDLGRRIAGADADRVGYERDLASVYNGLGDVMIGAGRGEEAARLYELAFDIARRLVAVEPGRSDHQR